MGWDLLQNGRPGRWVRSVKLATSERGAEGTGGGKITSDAVTGWVMFNSKWTRWGWRPRTQAASGWRSDSQTREDRAGL